MPPPSAERTTAAATAAPSTPEAIPPTRMPLAVYILGLSVFALGTSEFMLSGLLPPIAEDMNVSIPRAGLLISAFAIGMVVGAPLLAVATLRLPRKTTLVALITVFGLGQIAGALAPNYTVLFASRVVSALACAGFWAVGAAVAIAMVPVGARARAMAVMIGGLSIANVLGVPAGAFLGSTPWRSAFWAVGAASARARRRQCRSPPAHPAPRPGPASSGSATPRPQSSSPSRSRRSRRAASSAPSPTSPRSSPTSSGLDKSWVSAVLATSHRRPASDVPGAAPTAGGVFGTRSASTVPPGLTGGHTAPRTDRQRPGNALGTPLAQSG
ncbi:sugar efflux transporter [Streptomyces tanashiensis]